MKRVGLFCVVTLIVASCTSNSESTTTTLGGTTSTSEEAATTTTTAASASTTSTAVTTSSSTAPTTGDFAEQPIIVWPGWGGMVLGWWDGDSWGPPADLEFDGARDFTALSLSGMATVTGELGGLVCDFSLPWPSVDLSGMESVTHEIGDSLFESVSGVAISAPWDVQPRPAVETVVTPELVQAANAVVANAGFAVDSDVPVVQVVESDLNGDGTTETLVVAEDTELANEASGVFSVLFVVTPGLEGPLVVEQSVIPTDGSGFPGAFRISAIGDLNGDGVMEVVVEALAWEGSSASVHEFDGTGFTRVLNAGCGV